MDKQSQLPFLFLHGAGGTSSKWRRVKEYLADTPNRIIDLPAHGKDRSPVPSSIEEYAQVIDQSLEQDVIVVGHSMGGLIGIELAAKSERVKGLVLAASHYQLPVHPKILLSLSMGEFPDWFFQASYGKTASKDLLKEEKIELAFNPIHITLSDFDSCNRYRNGKSLLTQINKPILAVYGSQDKLIPRDAKEKLLELNPQAKIEVVEEAGHYLILEKPEPFVQAILNFRNMLA